MVFGPLNPRSLGLLTPGQFIVRGSSNFNMLYLPLAASLLLVSTDPSRQYRVSCNQNNAGDFLALAYSTILGFPFPTPCQTLVRILRSIKFNPECIRRVVIRMVSGASCNADGNRLNLGDFDDAGLNCDDDNWNDDRNDHIGAFALMMGKETRKTSQTLRCLSFRLCNHLPSIRPIVPSLSVTCAYFPVSNPFASQRSVVKNLSWSNFRLSVSRKIRLSSRLVYCAVSASSKISVKILSTLAPIVYRVSLGRWIKKLCHNK